MFRLFAFLLMLVVGVSGVLALDYNMARHGTGVGEGKDLTLAGYLTGLSGRLSSLVDTTAPDARSLPDDLSDMLPKPPMGWTSRPATEDDLDSFLVRKKRGGPDKQALAYVGAVLQPVKGKGVDSVAVAYEKGDRKVVFQLTRHPDKIFTDLAAIDQRVDLRQQAARFTATQFMTVRGLDVTEDLLPDGFRARLFLADVAGQIQLRILASDRLKDQDLLPFFQTLHVEAMNANVVDRREGLGELPVIVLVSALKTETRTAYETDLAARIAETAALNKAQRLLAKEAAGTTPEVPEEPESLGLLDSLFGVAPEPPVAADEAAATSQVVCTTGTGGSKKCSVTSAEPQD